MEVKKTITDSGTVIDYLIVLYCPSPGSCFPWWKEIVKLELAKMLFIKEKK